MPALVLAHIDRQLPPELCEGAQLRLLKSFADRKSLDQALRCTPAPERIIVVPSPGPAADGDLAAVLTRLMRREGLGVPLGYLPSAHTPCSKAHGLSLAPESAVAAPALARPLARDDDGNALVGEARATGPDGGPLVGESIVDDTRLHLGKAAQIVVRASGVAPGVLASARRTGWRGRLPPRWVAGRAAQIGAEALLLVRDGVPAPRTRAAVTFFRHTEDWLLVP